jgi:peptidyl-prolyl cis-trans isomerase A (cyclophilin A)
MLEAPAKSLAALFFAGLLACGDADSDQAGGGGSAPGGGGPAAGGGGAGEGGGGGPVDACADTDLTEENLGGGADPEAGNFTLDEALDGLPEGPGPLRAIIETEVGSIECELFPDAAPIGVANFVGLARGRRPFNSGQGWIKGRRFYDGLIFHRIIDDFMAQGGDPLGTGSGGPGYVFMNEVADTSHCEPADPPNPDHPLVCHFPGALAYANKSNANSNGSQFFIVSEVAQPHLDGGYTMFGKCGPMEVIQALTEVPVNGEKPIEDVHMISVEITRCAPGG